jgi:hypothetical protein
MADPNILTAPEHTERVAPAPMLASDIAVSHKAGLCQSPSHFCHSDLYEFCNVQVRKMVDPDILTAPEHTERVAPAPMLVSEIVVSHKAGLCQSPSCFCHSDLYDFCNVQV